MYIQTFCLPVVRSIIESTKIDLGHRTQRAHGGYSTVYRIRAQGHYGEQLSAFYKLCSVPRQEKIKVREWIPHIGLIPNVIPLKLFLEVIPSSSAVVTRALRRCFRGRYVYVDVVFRFASKQKKPSNAVHTGKSSLVFNIKESTSLCFSKFRNFKGGSLNRGRSWSYSWPRESYSYLMDRWQPKHSKYHMLSFAFRFRFFRIALFTSKLFDSRLKY